MGYRYRCEIVCEVNVLRYDDFVERCSDPVAIVYWGDVLFMSLRIEHMWGSTIFGSRSLIKVTLIYQNSSIRSVSYLVKRIITHANKSRYTHYKQIYVSSVTYIRSDKIFLFQTNTCPYQTKNTVR